jgi:hypothetical protein
VSGHLDPATTGPQPPSAHGAYRWRTLAMAALLAAVTITWAALPGRTGAYLRLALIAAIVTAVATLAQLAVSNVQPGSTAGFASLADRMLDWLVAMIKAIPWAELMTIAVLVLEVLHPARPWHTGVLGVAMLGFLISVHLAETGARASVLRPQVPLIAAGFGLAALAVGAAALPTLPVGSVSSVVRVIAAAAAVVAGALAVPVWLGRQR